MTEEAHSRVADAWVAQHITTEIVVSDWAMVEVSAALSRKVRKGALSIEDKSSALSKFKRMTDETAIVLPVERLHFRQAALFADAFKLSLQAGDALHLAVVQLNDLQLVTLDKQQNMAALALGIRSALLSSS